MTALGSPLGPGGRPFRRWRFLPLLLGLAVIGVNAVILLSDRAPGLLSRVSRRIDVGVARAGDVAGIHVSRSDVPVPESDFDIHVAIWAVAALLVGLATWSWVSLLLANGLLFVGSVGLELAQGAYSRSRTVQVSDLAGNAVGILAGTCAVAAFALAYGLVRTMQSPRRY